MRGRTGPDARSRGEPMKYVHLIHGRFEFSERPHLSYVAEPPEFPFGPQVRRSTAIAGIDVEPAWAALLRTWGLPPAMLLRFGDEALVLADRAEEAGCDSLARWLRDERATLQFALAYHRQPFVIRLRVLFAIGIAWIQQSALQDDGHWPLYAPLFFSGADPRLVAVCELLALDLRFDEETILFLNLRAEDLDELSAADADVLREAGRLARLAVLSARITI